MAIQEIESEVLERNVRDIVTKYSGKRRFLMRMLQEIQSLYGYLPRRALELLSKLTNIPLTDILSVATFYHQFKLEPSGMFIFLVCMGTACHLKGNMINYEFLRHYLNLKPGKRTTDDGIFSVEKARCFGCCSLAPVVMVLSRDGKYRKLYGYVDTAKLRKIVAEHRALARKLSNRRPR